MRNTIFKIIAAAIFLTTMPILAEVSRSDNSTPVGAASGFRFSEMVKFVDSLKNRIQNTYHPHSAERSIWSNEPIPFTLMNIFDRLQTALFGDFHPLKLKSCSNCHALTDFDSGTIYVQNTYIEGIESNPDIKDSQTAVAFILAHEIGHVVQGLSASHANGLDINGLPSLMTTSFGSDASDADLKPLFIAHAEVDAFGLIVMKKAGFKRFNDAYTVLETMRVQGDHWNNLDIDTRLSQILKSVDHVWRPSGLTDRIR